MPSESPTYLSGSCIHCGGPFEFEESAAGAVVPCPHCGQETRLFSLAISFDLPATSAPPMVAPEPASAPASAPASDDGFGLPHYASGGVIRAGDRVHYQEGYATVVFVSNGEREEYAPGYEDFRGQDAGVIICDDDGETTFVREGDEALSLAHRK